MDFSMLWTGVMSRRDSRKSGSYFNYLFHFIFMAEYVPGKCNIGVRERNNRYIIGVSGLIAAALSVGATVYYGLPNYVAIFSYIPFFLGFEGIFQAITGFCVHYAQEGVYEMDGELEEVESKKDHEKDFRKAMRIHIASVIAAGISTAMVYLSLI